MTAQVSYICFSFLALDIFRKKRVVYLAGFCFYCIYLFIFRRVTANEKLAHQVFQAVLCYLAIAFYNALGTFASKMKSLALTRSILLFKKINK